jgi:uncharacterized membrane-anchored protein
MDMFNVHADVDGHVHGFDRIKDNNIFALCATEKR